MEARTEDVRHIHSTTGSRGGCQRAGHNLDDSVSDFGAGHAPGEARSGVPVRHVRDQLQAELAGVQHALQDACGRGGPLHGRFSHDARLQDLPQQPREHPRPRLLGREGHSVGSYHQPVTWEPRGLGGWEAVQARIARAEVLMWEIFAHTEDHTGSRDARGFCIAL